MSSVDSRSNLLVSFIVPKTVQRVRLSEYAHKIFKAYLPSKKSVKKALKQERIYLNGSIGYSGDFVSENMKVDLYEEIFTPSKIFNHKIEVLYEDDSLAVINKPSGYPVNGNYFKTIQNALPYNLKPSPLKDGLPWPLPCHRLDALTSGCLIIAKTKTAQIDIGQQFEAKTILKEYVALVVGRATLKGMINLDIDEQEACSMFELLAIQDSLTYTKISLLKLFPSTGRTHQLRIHCADMGHPIIGDKLYSGDKKVPKGKGLFLHSSKIDFNHPEDGSRLSFEAAVPNKFNLYLKKEKDRYDKFII